MAKTKPKETKTPSFDIRESEAEFRAEIPDDELRAYIKVNVRAWKGPGGRGRAGKLDLVLSFYQAVALTEILEGFTVSRRCRKKAQTPVVIKWDGETRWSTFPYPF